MDHTPELPENLPRLWRERVEQLRDWGGSTEAARLWERAAVELEQALRSRGGETLTLAQAARASGLTAGYLGDLVRAGKIPNAGRRNAPRIRRADLPARKREPERPPRRSSSRREITAIAERLRKR
jgi:hypothetical protein